MIHSVFRTKQFENICVNLFQFCVSNFSKKATTISEPVLRTCCIKYSYGADLTKQTGELSSYSRTRPPEQSQVSMVEVLKSRQVRGFCTVLHINGNRAEAVGRFEDFQGNQKTYREVKHDIDNTSTRQAASCSYKFKCDAELKNRQLKAEIFSNVSAARLLYSAMQPTVMPGSAVRLARMACPAGCFASASELVSSSQPTYFLVLSGFLPGCFGSAAWLVGSTPPTYLLTRSGFPAGWLGSSVGLPGTYPPTLWPARFCCPGG